MSKIWSIIIIASVVYVIFTGNAGTVVECITNASKNAIENIITLAGMICFWTGVFNILQHTSISKKLSNMLKRPLIKLLNKEEINDDILTNASINVASNVIGVGNAATVYGIKTIEGMQKINDKKTVPNDSMTTFILLNTASVQLIPTTIISLRMLYGSKAPNGIIVAVWIVSIVALVAGLVSIKVLNKVVK